MLVSLVALLGDIFQVGISVHFYILIRPPDVV